MKMVKYYRTLRISIKTWRGELMKKIKLLILSILCVFLSINNVKAFEAFQVDVSSSFNPLIYIAIIKAAAW